MNGNTSKTPYKEDRQIKICINMEDINILAFFLSYPSLPIDASDESSE